MPGALKRIVNTPLSLLQSPGRPTEPTLPLLPRAAILRTEVGPSYAPRVGPSYGSPALLMKQDHLGKAPHTIYPDHEEDCSSWTAPYHQKCGRTPLTRPFPYAEVSFAIENYLRDIKRYCGVERSPARSEQAQRHHIGWALRAFLRLEWHFFTMGISAFEAKLRLARDAVRSYLSWPFLTLPKMATA